MWAGPPPDKNSSPSFRRCGCCCSWILLYSPAVPLCTALLSLYTTPADQPADPRCNPLHPQRSHLSDGHEVMPRGGSSSPLHAFRRQVRIIYMHRSPGRLGPILCCLPPYANKDYAVRCGSVVQRQQRVASHIMPQSSEANHRHSQQSQQRWAHSLQRRWHRIQLTSSALSPSWVFVGPCKCKPHQPQSMRMHPCSHSSSVCLCQPHMPKHISTAYKFFYLRWLRKGRRLSTQTKYQ